MGLLFHRWIVLACCIMIGADQAIAAEPKEATDLAARASNEFGVDVYKKLAEGNKNMFVSPPSLIAVLGMLELGARTGTRDEIRSVLHLAGEKSGAEALRPLAPLLNQNGDGYLLKSANHVWIQNGLAVNSEFQKSLDQVFRAKATSVDFANGSAATDQINEWVDDNTNGRIRQLFSSPLDSSNLLVLTNAVFFKGTWKHRFDPKRTRPMPFTLADGKKVDTPTMYQSEQFRFWESKELQALELPYEGNAVSTFILLPTKPDGLSELEKKLTKKDLDNWITSTTKSEGTNVDVYLPSFEVESNLDLEKTLVNLGMTKASRPGADLSGIAPGNLQLTRVLQKTFVQVDEKGTTAAAATGGAVAASLSPQFRCNHPFLMVIRENKSGLLLFVGRFVQPGVR